MSASFQYRDSYPRSGRVALLCEGDLIGYESSILTRWLDRRLGTNPLVDIWPCGTAQAIFGISDAIGRSRPVIIIEDKDFRSQSQAVGECGAIKKGREERGITILAWQSWSRNEIENYLLEPQVVLPCFAQAFECTESEVEQSLVALLPALAVFQCVHFALYHTRKLWSKSDPSPVLPNQLKLAPLWDDNTKAISAPSFEVAVGQLTVNLGKWQAQLKADGMFLDDSYVECFLDHLKQKFTEWRSPSLNSDFWRFDWSGKDVLQWLRIAMTSKRGWKNLATGERDPMRWSGLSRSKRNEQDRPVEDALRPMLVHAFVRHLQQLSSGALFDEWNGLAHTCKNTET